MEGTLQFIVTCVSEWEHFTSVKLLTYSDQITDRLWKTITVSSESIFLSSESKQKFWNLGQSANRRQNKKKKCNEKVVWLVYSESFAWWEWFLDFRCDDCHYVMQWQLRQFTSGVKLFDARLYIVARVFYIFFAYIFVHIYMWILLNQVNNLLDWFN